MRTIRRIEGSRKSYFKYVLINVFKLLILFVFVLGSIFLIDRWTHFITIDKFTLVAIAGISFVSLSFEYAMFFHL